MAGGAREPAESGAELGAVAGAGEHGERRRVAALGPRPKGDLLEGNEPRRACSSICRCPPRGRGCSVTNRSRPRNLRPPPPPVQSGADVRTRLEPTHGPIESPAPPPPGTPGRSASRLGDPPRRLPAPDERFPARPGLLRRPDRGDPRSRARRARGAGHAGQPREPFD